MTNLYTAPKQIHNRLDVIDSRDVIERIEFLNELGEDRDYEDDAELVALDGLEADASGYADDWEYGEALIRFSYFEDYAREIAEDCGMFDSTATWPMNCIDWEQAAGELAMDYTAVDFGGVEYLIR
jgi:hypothetical protein